MKIQPQSYTLDGRPVNVPRSKSRFQVTIEDEVYITWAYNEEFALFNAAYRYGIDNDLNPGLIRWQIKNDRLYYTVEVLE